MPSPLRSIALFSLTSALLFGLVSPGCSRQGEGERCDNARTGDSDCDSGLECKQASELLEMITDRCCKPDGSYDDARCTPIGVIGSGGRGGSGGGGSTPEAGAGGTPESGGAPAGGAPPEQGGQPGTAGTPTMSEAGAPSSGGTPQAGAGGQGGAD